MAVLLKWTIASALGLAFATSVSAATLSAALLPKVRAATFEVVAAKADESKVVYERPLPLDQIPFQQRNDKYRSLGTAFAVGDGHFVTAMHVFMEGIDSLQGPLALRDEQGHVFAIDKVLKFSAQEDFVEFTLKSAPAIDPLPVERSAQVNEAVFAVGNALGTGVVVRDGLYTSDTPEEHDGKWKWMRFSAPASPGNSGGPLIDEQGKVIGVVLRKSSNENLNFALPIGRVLDASDKQSVVDVPHHFHPPYSTEIHRGTLTATIDLPLTYDAFNARISRVFGDEAAGSIQAWLKENSKTLFPEGTGSHDLLLHGAWTSSLPTMITQQGNGNWVRPAPHPTHMPIADKGYIEQIAMGGGMSWHIHSEGAPLGSGDGGQANMDLLLQDGNLHRDVGDEKVKVTSLGRPLSTEAFTDRLGRTWHIDAFALPFLDSEILLATTPTPDGEAGLLRFSRAREKAEIALQMRMTVDLLEIAYRGTLPQWQAFLARGSRPTVLKGASIRADKQGLAVSADDVTANWPASVVPLGNRTEVIVEPSWTMENDKAAVHVRRLAVSQQDSPKNSLVLDRYERAFDDSPEEAVSFWRDLMIHAHPRDGQPLDHDDRRSMADVYDPKQPDTARHAYALYYSIVGKATDDELRARLLEAERGTVIPGYTPFKPDSAAP